MDYSSSLGPIDPQVYNGMNWVPALGYLDKVEELICKSAKGTLTQAELVMLTQQDLAMLRRHEQARDLTVALLNILRLEIEDYSNDLILKPLIRQYNDLICQYILKSGSEVYLHSRKFI